MQRFEFRIEVNLDAMTHLRIWKPIMKNASTLAEKISMEVTQDLYQDRFISFQPSNSICKIKYRSFH
ncbi:hypothetical protein CMV_009814 [Castanea mollissima]|uniref:Uncharacterized protein n=1 Tax=Castanea mollissima TaxID=60419 RepID=A0A8J4VQJ9_9ROSI|nr:hypothetical protein CMV_009814 [Castanea mollissima]